MKRVLFILGIIGACLCIIGCGEKKHSSTNASDVPNIPKYDYFKSYEKDIPELLSIEEVNRKYIDDVEYVKNTNGHVDYSDCYFNSSLNISRIGLFKVNDLVGMTKEEGKEYIKNWLHEKHIDPTNFDELVEYFGMDTEGPMSGFWTYTDENYKLYEISTGILALSDRKISKELGEENWDYDALEVLYQKGSRDPTEYLEKLGYVERLRNESYELFDGKQSIGDAADMVEAYFEKGDPYEFNDDIDTEAYYVSVVKINDKFCYRFYFRRVVYGIPFYTEKSEQFNTLPDYNIVGMPGVATVVDKEGVSSYVGALAGGEKLEFISEYDKLIGLKEATQIVENNIARELIVKADSAQLLYSGFVFKTGQMKDLIYDDGHIGSIPEEETLEVPTWVIDGKIENSKQNIRIYVDAISGKITYVRYIWQP